MAQNLLKNKTQVKVYDLNLTAIATLQSSGASVATTVEDMVDCHTIITMLPSSPHVKGTVDKLLAAGWGEGSDNGISNLLIDSSTIDPIVTKELAVIIANIGGNNSTMIDAPVSGGVNGAKNGTLTFMVGGTDDSVSEATQYL